MWFASPLWLLALLPWAAISIWMMWGRSPEASVPFLELWAEALTSRQSSRGVHLPPLGIVAALLAMLFALLGAAGPRLAHDNAKNSIAILVDRGDSMSARGKNRERFKELSLEVSRQIQTQLGGTAPVTLNIVPGDLTTSDLSHWDRTVSQSDPTAIDTTKLLPAAISSALAAHSGPVVVITDHRLPVSDPRVMQVAPSQSISDVAVAAIGLNQSAGNELMIRIANASEQKSARLKIRSGDAAVQQDIKLPPRSVQSDFFVDLSKLGNTVQIELECDDDFPANNVAWLVREGSWPRIETRASVTPELARVIEIYQARRPPGAQSQRLPIVSDLKALREQEAGIVLSRHNLQPASGAVQTRVHDLTTGAHFDDLHDIELADDPPAGWQAILSIAGRPLLAVAPADQHRVWVGFDSRTFATRPDFVVFYAKLFDWAGAGTDAFTFHRVGDLSTDWQPVTAASNRPGNASLWPGVYRSPAGKLAAVNALGPVQGQVTARNWQGDLAHWKAANAGIALSPLLLLAALGLIVTAAALWR